MQGLRADSSAARELSIISTIMAMSAKWIRIFIPLLQQLFLEERCFLLMLRGCSDEAASGHDASAIIDMHAVSQQHFEAVDDELMGAAA